MPYILTYSPYKYTLSKMLFVMGKACLCLQIFPVQCNLQGVKLYIYIIFFVIYVILHII